MGWPSRDRNWHLFDPSCGMWRLDVAEGKRRIMQDATNVQQFPFDSRFGQLTNKINYSTVSSISLFGPF